MERMLAIPSPLNHTRPYPGRVPIWETSTTPELQWIFVYCSDSWMSVSSWGLLNTSMGEPVSSRIQLGSMAPFFRKVCVKRKLWSQAFYRLSSSGGSFLPAPNRIASMSSSGLFAPSSRVR